MDVLLVRVDDVSRTHMLHYLLKILETMPRQDAVWIGSTDDNGGPTERPMEQPPLFAVIAREDFPLAIARAIELIGGA